MSGFYIKTYGCQMNVADADWLSRALAAQGLEPVAEAEARALIVTTCSVRDKPEQKVYSQLGRWREHWERDNRVFAVVGGCVAQQIGAGFFGRFPFVRCVFGADGTAAAPDAILRLMDNPELRFDLTSFSEDYPDRPTHLEELHEGPHGRAQAPTAYVTIMQGCDNYCAYCIVPYTRGRQKSRPAEAVLDECRQLVRRGVREITLLGQNVNAYGLDDHGDGTSFLDILKRVARVDGLQRIRFTTSHPKDLSHEVINLFGEEPKICPRLHLPLQSGSDRVLAAMGRGYDMRRYLDLVGRLRAARSDIALTTDLMVGFPGETEEDFEDTLRAVDAVRFDNAFSFIYSDRPGTAAENLPDKVAESVKSERLARLQERQHRHTRQALEAMVGRELGVLLEGPARRERQYTGRDPYNHPVNVTFPEDADPGPDAAPGLFVSARVRQAKKHSLDAETEGAA